MATITLNISDSFAQLVSKFNELSSGVGNLTGLDIGGESDISNILTTMYSLIDSDTDFRNKISVTDAGGDGSLSYNSTSGVITYTGPSASEVRAKISVTDAGGDGSLSYNSGTGVITYTGPSAAEVRSHFSASGDLTYNASTGVFSFSDSAQRSDAAIRSLFSATDNGGDGSFSYNSTTGAFSYTGPSASEVRAHFSAGTAITLSSGQISVTSGSITETQLGNDAVSRAKLKDEVGLVIYNSSGTALKTMYGAGS